MLSSQVHCRSMWRRDAVRSASVMLTRCSSRVWSRMAVRGVLNSWVTPPMKSRCRSAVSDSSATWRWTAPAMMLKSSARAPISSRERTSARMPYSPPAMRLAAAERAARGLAPFRISSVTAPAPAPTPPRLTARKISAMRSRSRWISVTSTTV